MKMKPGDQNVVDNLHQRYGDKLKPYSDAHILARWWEFSSSDDFGNEDKFLEWLE